ncbi:M28 family metallopeptidase [Photobacterium galatheae]|uniref:Aminopeptidase Y n=1 Tax=Photobacterium galatheae TaxID=1654360 RepID=A0A066RMR5_9GAMM|nr:M28 family metallopeptidase [Photobacterium galatheae]KDM91639.1 aminopeptidase Y [Photobacterium galatheae]MCM0149713.1 M20/M25/M40 family metallo-hydrolase [Photobacterium galatheae]
MQVSMTTTKTLLATVISATMLTGCYWKDPQSAAAYVSSEIDREEVVEHLEELEARASKTTDGNSVTRAAGTDGYQYSVDYIIDVMKAHGYRVSTQEFDFRAWEELTGTKLNVNGVDLISTREAGEGVEPDYAVMSYSGNSNGELTGQAVFVTPDFNFGAPDYDDTDGCEAADFTGKDVAGKIAVIQRGGCAFSDKVVNAQNAGAKAVIIFNQGNSEGRTSVVNGTLGSDTTAAIPAYGSRYDLGKQWFDLSATQAVPVSLSVSVKDEMVVTQNVIAETKRGNPNQVVMLGAHLDSVPEGPGINDNGSGTAGLLEYAVTLAETKAPVKNKVRFAWWAAEEAGLVGSEYYTKDLFEPIYNQAQKEILEELGLEDPSQLTEEQIEMVDARYSKLNKVKLYLNFDMIASPNYIYGVMDGDLSDTKDSPDNAYTGDFKPPYGTSDIESVFNEFFGAKSESTIPQALSKRSDYAGFADWGVAFGGLFTGAEKVKTAEEVEKFGGEIDVAYDKCYHQACDDLNNVSQEALYTNTQALAYVTTYYAFSKPLFPPKEEPAVKPMTRMHADKPVQKLRIGEKLKAAESHSDHGHFHGDFDQDRQ